MRKLVNYFRSLFCKHEWELIFDNEVIDMYYGHQVGKHRQKTYRCKKCGMEQKYDNA